MYLTAPKLSKIQLTSKAAFAVGGVAEDCHVCQPL
jgi:hypothetical protein